MTNIISRKDLISKLVPPDTIGIEVGIFTGTFTRELLDGCNPKKILCIDLWDSGRIDWFVHNKETNTWKSEGSSSSDALSVFNINMKEEIERNIVVPIRGRSPEILHSLRSDYFDWIYLDGQHDYRTLSKELIESKRIVKNGGYIMGHDYCSLFPGIVRAVDEFATREKLELILTNEEPSPVWRPNPIDGETASYNSFIFCNT